MYADDAAIFTNPTKEDLDAIKMMLQVFGNASGLYINIQKSSIHMIRCQYLDLDQVLSDFQGVRSSFPCRYLGL